MTDPLRGYLIPNLVFTAAVKQCAEQGEFHRAWHLIVNGYVGFFLPVSELDRPRRKKILRWLGQIVVALYSAIGDDVLRNQRVSGLFLRRRENSFRFLEHLALERFGIFLHRGMAIAFYVSGFIDRERRPRRTMSATYARPGIVKTAGSRRTPPGRVA